MNRLTRLLVRVGCWLFLHDPEHDEDGFIIGCKRCGLPAEAIPEFLTYNRRKHEGG